MFRVHTFLQQEAAAAHSTPPCIVCHANTTHVHATNRHYLCVLEMQGELQDPDHRPLSRTLPACIHLSHAAPAAILFACLVNERMVLGMSYYYSPDNPWIINCTSIDYDKRLTVLLPARDSQSEPEGLHVVSQRSRVHTVGPRVVLVTTDCPPPPTSTP